MSENLEAQTPDVYDILPEEEIIARAGNIDPVAAAKEVLNWLVNNVQQYVDNQRKTYRLYITVADSTGMPQISELQALYLAIESPEDSDDKGGLEREGRCLDVLDDITEKVQESLMSDKEGLESLYSALIYYYEMIGFSSQSGPILQKFSGYVDIKLFLYEPVVIKVQVKEGNGGEVTKEDTIPEGFGIEFVLKAWPNSERTMY